MTKHKPARTKREINMIEVSKFPGDAITNEKKIDFLLNLAKKMNHGVIGTVNNIHIIVSPVFSHWPH